MPRPKGLPKTGGKRKGSKNKHTIALEKAAGGTLPLDYMLKVMRNSKAKAELRAEMAKAAAPYVHARRAAEDGGGNTAPPMFYVTPNLESDDE